MTTHPPIPRQAAQARIRRLVPFAVDVSSTAEPCPHCAAPLWSYHTSEADDAPVLHWCAMCGTVDGDK